MKAIRSTAGRHGLELAVIALGSQAKLARALGVSPGRVSQWRRLAEPLPPERCLQIEQLTRAIALEAGDQSLIVACEELRPDLAWSMVRGNPRPVRVVALPPAAASPSPH